MVKAYLTTREDINKSIQVVTGISQDYSPTYPTLEIKDNLFITGSVNIINFLKTLKIHDSK